MRWLAALAIVPCLAMTLCAQDTQQPPKLFSSDLVAWSAMQRPQEPEQSPESRPRQVPITQETIVPSQVTSPSQDLGSAASPAASTFIGTVTRQGDDFVLVVSETATYKLDAKARIEQYEGQRVRVTGSVESGVNLIHVDRIEPMS